MKIGTRRLCLMFKLFDCGAAIGVGLKVGSWRRAWKVRNPFRIILSDADYYAGKPRYRWPFGAFDRG